MFIKYYFEIKYIKGDKKVKKIILRMDKDSKIR